VTVFGLVSTLGAGTHPTAMVFSSARQGQNFTAPVTNGSFSIKIPNQDSYDVSLKWAGNYTWQTGQTDRGQLTVNMTAGSMGAMSCNVVQMTPSSMVRVEGSISWGVVTSSPVAIKFTAADGEVFQASVSNKTFTTVLPNMMNYNVEVASQNATGYMDWYAFQQLQVNVGINVVGLMVRITN
jgi:hypothetical protein